jgi:hypothetical protein
MQSPKLPVYNAGYLSTSNVSVSPSAFVACIVAGPSEDGDDVVDAEDDCARADGIKVLRRTNAVAHADAENEGNRAILSQWM